MRQIIKTNIIYLNMENTEIKTEFTNHMLFIMLNHIYSGLQLIYNSAENIKIKYNEKNKTIGNTIKIFKILLKDIGILPESKINNDVSKLLSKCHYIQNLLDATYKSWIVVLTGKPCIDNHTININNFVHKCYIEATQNLLENGQALNEFSADVTNKNISKDIVKYSILNAFLLEIPFDVIFKEYLKPKIIEPIKSSENKIDVIKSEIPKKIIEIDLSKYNDDKSKPIEENHEEENHINLIKLSDCAQDFSD